MSSMAARRAWRVQIAERDNLLSPLLCVLGADELRTIAKRLPDSDLTCFRLVCKTFRDHSAKPAEKCRESFLRTRALAAFAWKSMPGFVVAAPYRRRMLCLAAAVGCEGVLEELVDRRQCELSAGACVAAAREGNLCALGWLHSRGCAWDGRTSAVAALGGHLAVLRFAHAHGCHWYRGTCSEAARGGHLQVLRYAHEHGCKWSTGTCSQAAAGGYLEVLRYAHEHGCPWDSRTCLRAAAGGHLEALTYAKEHGCLMQLYPCHAAALSNGHTEVVEYLHTISLAA
jgi:hypothetical protein